MKWAALGITAAGVAGIATVLYQNQQAKAEILSQLRKKQAANRERKVDEHDAIYNYVLSSYGMNRKLRSPEGAGALDERGQTIMRGLDSWLSKAPRQEGTYFRGIPGTARSEWDTVKPGDTVTEKAYSSFSKDEKVATSFADSPTSKPGVLVVTNGRLPAMPYHVSSRYGKKLNETIKGESEYLAERNAQFKVTKVEERELRFTASPTTGKEVPDPKGAIIKRLRVVYVDMPSGGSRGDGRSTEYYRTHPEARARRQRAPGAERNTPLCLSRAKWKCSGKTSRRDGLTPGKSSTW